MGIVNRMARLGARHFGRSLANKIENDRNRELRGEPKKRPQTDDEWWNSSMFNPDRKRGWW